MDFYSSNKIFKRMITKKGKVVFVLSEETIETLKRWELNEDVAGALVKLRRMLHTAPSNERRKIAKAILELEKKRKEEKRSEAGENIEKRKDYIIYGAWGEDQRFGRRDEATPDLWWSHDTMKWSSDYVRTFIYIPDGDILLMNDLSGQDYTHMTMIKDMIDDNEITHGDFDSDLLSKYGGNLYSLISDDDLKDENIIIHGRTGPLPLRSKPENTKFYVSIWNAEVDRNALDGMMKEINKKLKIPFKRLLVPENV